MKTPKMEPAQVEIMQLPLTQNQFMIVLASLAMGGSLIRSDWVAIQQFHLMLQSYILDEPTDLLVITHNLKRLGGPLGWVPED